MLLSLLFIVSFSNAATITSTAASGTWSTRSTLIGGNVPVTGDTVIIATTGTGKVTITANLTQTASGSVTVNSGAILTTSGGTIVFGLLTIISGGTVTVSRATTVLGATNISGTLNFSSTSGTSRLITFTGDVTLNGSAVWTEPSTGNGANNTYNFRGNFTNNATTFNALGTGLHTFSGATKTISGSRVTSIPSITFTGAYTNNSIINCAKALTVTGVTLTNNGTITATTALSGTGGLTQGTSGVLNIGVCTSAASNVVIVTVSPVAKVAAITGFNTSTTKACVGSPKKLTLSAGYVGTIEWLSSPTLTGTYTPIGGATSPSYDYTSAEAGVKYFKVRTTSSPCSASALSTTGVAVMQIIVRLLENN